MVLLRHGRGSPDVLLGRRRRSLRFLPGFYVFPGGRLEAQDSRPSAFQERPPAPPAGTDRSTRRRMASFIRAALRETFEETGLLLGRAGSAPEPRRKPWPGVWRHYAERGLEPAFADLNLVARAITPSVSPIRFHTRFFLADGALAQGQPRDSDELEDVGWVPLSRVAALPLIDVTQMVLEECLARTAGGAGRPAPLFGWVGAEQRPRHRIGQSRGLDKA